MYHKLLIALCTLSMLTACGGSDNDGDPSRMILNPPEDLNSGDEDTEGGTDDEDEETGGEGEEQPPVEWVLQTFETDSAVDAWQFECVSTDCNASATFAHNADEQTLDVTPEWTQDGEQLEVFTAIDPEIADMTEGNMFVHFFVPSAYTDAGHLIIQVFLKDASDRKGYIGYTTAAAGWNAFSFEGLTSGTDGAYGDFGFHSDGFNLQNINAIGLQFQADAGLVGVSATLQIDDVVLSPEPIMVDEKVVDEEPTPVSNADINFPFTDGIDGWFINGEPTNDIQSTDNLELTHDSEAGALNITPKDWTADNWRLQAKTTFATSADLTNATMELTLDIPASYISDGGVNLQVIIEAAGGTSYGTYLDKSTWSAGENELTLDLTDRGDLSEATSLAIQFATPPTDTSLLDTIAVKNIDIHLAE